MNEKKYHVDNKPVSARELIDMAKDINEEYRESLINQTSVAASILRDNGHIVGDL